MNKAISMDGICVKKRNGILESLDLEKINISAARACEGLLNVSSSEVVLDASLSLYDGVATKDIDVALIISAKSKIEKEPEYTYVASRLLLNTIYKESFGTGVEKEFFEEQYRQAFIENLHTLVEEGRVNPALLDFDLETLSKHIVIERDLKFKFAGIQTIIDRYLLKSREGKVLETPQAFFMRVAMGLCLNEENKTERVIEFYNLMSNFLYMPSTPTLFNSGTTHSQLSSCFLSTMDDSEDGIMGTWHDQARLSKYAGGLGVDAQPIRATGSYIHGTGGKSGGPVPFLKIFNDVLLAFNQGGKRNGSGVVYFEPTHLDIEDILDLKKNTGDERRRCHEMNTALWVSDLFFKKVEEDADWYLFCPSETPKLHSLYGKKYVREYNKCVKKALGGEIRYKVVKAKDLFKKIITSLFETGHPWICFKDAANICYSNKNEGVVYSSNLCTEILRHTIATLYKMGKKKKIGETAVCNLGSINYREHLEFNEEISSYVIDEEKLAKTCNTAIRMLDNVIDINFYPIEEAQNSNLKHRPIGLGTMGFTDALNALQIPYESDEAVKLASRLQEIVSFNAISASVDLAKERGKFSTYEGSEWSKGNFPQDMFRILHEERGTEPNLPSNEISENTWNNLRTKMLVHGIRNASVLAIAPNATISTICGCSASIDPDYKLVYTYDTMSGSLTYINEWFVKKAKELGIWCQEFVDAVKRVDGDVKKLNVPAEIKKQFKTAFDIDYKYLVDCAAARQQWIDMGQSFNIYCDKTSMKHCADIYLYCFKKGLKTTYYFRTLGASTIEKSTVEKEKEASLCSIEAMKRGEICESCQ
jgi:ribonucleoside-diphosphate reductase alpha chain